MLAAFLALASSGGQLALEPFYDRPKAARAFEDYLSCVGGGLHSRSQDYRAARVIADEVRAECQFKTDKVRKELVAVYDADETLRPDGATSTEAAQKYVDRMTGRVEATIEQFRAQQKASSAPNQ